MPRRFQIRNFCSPSAISFLAELFKPSIGVSVFGSETRITKLIAPKICTKNDVHVPYVSSQFQVSNFICFKVMRFDFLISEFVIFYEKDKDFRSKASWKSQ